MTIIAWDGKTLATDRRAQSGGTIRKVCKIYMCGDTEAMAATGNLDQCLALMSWYRSGANEAKWPTWQDKNDPCLLVVMDIVDGEVFYYEALPEKIYILDKFMAWGSGRDVALGAMAMGADARKAVEITSLFDCNCGDGCDAIDIIKELK